MSFTDLYLSQSGAGTQSGLDISNPKPASFFNSAGNWGSGSNLIGAGTTVHLSGTFTSDLRFQGSGAAGNRIKLYFEPNAKFSAATWNDNESIIWSQGEVRRDHIEVDGGVNGLIEATNNGSPANWANQNQYSGIYFPRTSTDIIVHDVTVRNMYIHDDFNDNAVVGKGQGINLSSCNDSRIYNCVIHDSCIGIVIAWTAGMTNMEVDHNTVSRCNWCVGVGNDQDVVLDNVKIHDNDFSDWVNWDDVDDRYHHNGIYLFQSTDGGTVTNYQVYNNYFHGDPGLHMTANIFMSKGTQGTNTNSRFYNNIHYMFNNVPTNGFYSVGYDTGGPQTGTFGVTIVNNTMTYAVQSSGNKSIHVNTKDTIFENNIIVNVGTIYFIVDYTDPPPPDGSFNVCDYNCFFNWTGFGPSADARPLIATWQADTGNDLHSLTTSPGLDVNHFPSALSAVFRTGINLTSLGITGLMQSKNSVSRPTSGNWTMGANDVDSTPQGNIVLMGSSLT